MGRCYLFTCSKCNYVARVAGQEDGGYNCWLATFVCRECRQLYDLATLVRLPAALALKTQAGAGSTYSRFPRKVAAADLKEIVPAQAYFSGEIVPGQPQLPDAILPTRLDPRWVQLQVQCPVARHHHLQSWRDPGRCPKCATYLDKSLVPFRIWD